MFLMPFSLIKLFKAFLKHLKYKTIFLGLLLVNLRYYLGKDTEPIYSKFDYGENDQNRTCNVKANRMIL